MYYIKGHGWFVVRDSARKHGISGGDMCHAIAHSILVLVVDRGPRGRAIHLGASPSGSLLEVVTVDEGDIEVPGVTCDGPGLRERIAVY